MRDPAPGDGEFDGSSRNPAPLPAAAQLKEAGRREEFALQRRIGARAGALRLHPAPVCAADTDVGSERVGEGEVDLLDPDPVREVLFAQEGEEAAFILAHPGDERRQYLQSARRERPRRLQDLGHAGAIVHAVQPARGDHVVDQSIRQGRRGCLPQAVDDLGDQLVELLAVLDQAQAREAPLDLAPFRARRLVEARRVGEQVLVEEQREAHARPACPRGPLGQSLHEVELGGTAVGHQALQMPTELVPDHADVVPAAFAHRLGEAVHGLRDVAHADRRRDLRERFLDEAGEHHGLAARLPRRASGKLAAESRVDAGDSSRQVAEPPQLVGIVLDEERADACRQALAAAVGSDDHGRCARPDHRAHDRERAAGRVVMSEALGVGEVLAQAHRAEERGGRAQVDVPIRS